VPVKCNLTAAVAALGTEGTLSTTPRYNPTGEEYVVVGTEVTVQCGPNHGVTENGNDEVVPSGAESSASWVCGEYNRQAQGPPTCTTPIYYCRPKVCGDFVVPGPDATAFVKRGTNPPSSSFSSSDIIFGVAFGDEITVQCNAKKIGGTSCSDKCVYGCNGRNGPLPPITCQDAEMQFANWQVKLCRLVELMCPTVMRIMNINYCVPTIMGPDRPHTTFEAAFREGCTG